MNQSMSQGPRVESEGPIDIDGQSLILQAITGGMGGTCFAVVNRGTRNGVEGRIVISASFSRDRAIALATEIIRKERP